MPTHSTNNIQLVNAYMYMTGFICTLVQAFFIHRCWMIFGKRILPIIPFLGLILLSFVSGIIVVSPNLVYPYGI